MRWLLCLIVFITSSCATLLPVVEKEAEEMVEAINKEAVVEIVDNRIGDLCIYFIFILLFIAFVTVYTLRNSIVSPAMTGTSSKPVNATDNKENIL